MSTTYFPERSEGESSRMALDWRPSALGALRSIETECRNFEWDGTGSQPVEPATLISAHRLIVDLYRQLPTGIPAPDIVPEHDGEIDFSWFSPGGTSVSFSLGTFRKGQFCRQLWRKGSNPWVEAF